MKALVIEALLRDTVTGAVRWYRDSNTRKPGEPAHPWFAQWAAMSPDERQMHARYMWLDGNYSCDCNRGLFLWDWGRVKGPPADDPRCEDAEEPWRLVCCPGNTIMLESLRVDGVQVLDLDERGAPAW